MKNLKIKFLPATFAFILSCGVNAFAQSNWLDMKPLPNWNERSRAILQTEKILQTDLARCRNIVRPASLAVDHLLTKNGWTLVGEAQIFGKTTVVTVATGFDGQCRPRGFDTLVFVGDRVAGKLSPGPMDSRTDGYLTNVNLITETSLTAYYARYRANDPLCCPWKTEAITFIIKPDGKNFLLVPEMKISAGESTENQSSGNALTLNNTVWRWQSSESATGKITVDKPENYQLEFMANGKIRVKADCNTGGGSYMTEDNNISFVRIFTTKMFCGEKSLDSRFMQGLESARSFRVEGNNLLIGGEGENGTMKFFRVYRQDK
ncbi:MAG: META domain-containing protein [Acidobacteriota bacterium]|nr:META domain-containing protein [Acidobacteriota bacterium]